jgi:hypothetical protein
MTVSTFPSAVVDFGTSVAIERAKSKQSADDLGNREFLLGKECEWPVGGKEMYLAAMAQMIVVTWAVVLRMDWVWGRRRRSQRERNLPSGPRAHVRQHGQCLAGGSLREQRGIVVGAREDAMQRAEGRWIGCAVGLNCLVRDG